MAKEPKSKIASRGQAGDKEPGRPAGSLDPLNRKALERIRAKPDFFLGLKPESAAAELGRPTPTIRRLLAKVAAEVNPQPPFEPLDQYWRLASEAELRRKLDERSQWLVRA